MALMMRVLAASGGTPLIDADWSSTSALDPSGGKAAVMRSDEALSSGTSDAPQLSIRASQGAFIIGWPLSASGWMLEESSNLTPLSQWECVPSGQYQANSTNTF